MLRATFLGTASARPTVRRNVSAIAVHRGADLFLFDCGEGTQRQMMRFGVGFAVRAIFVTHMHADHYLGITGLLRTMSLQDRQEPLAIWGPPGSGTTLGTLVELGGNRVGFPVDIGELGPGEGERFDGYAIRAFQTRHTPTSLGYCLDEDERLGRFEVERARELGVPEGPSFGLLHQGEPVELPDGRVVQPEEVVGSPRPGRKLVYTGDTGPARSVVEAARGADLLIHEATFGNEERKRARKTGHATAEEAAQTAERAGVLELVLTHLSARYSETPERLEEEARAVFRRCRVAHDGLVVQVPLRAASLAEKALGGE
ncbi:MAG: ribonuclease Z [Gemmatimonadota bacterium]